MNYENDVTIEESALDLEWLQQPKLMMNYAQLAAEAAKEYEIAKEKIAITKAELDKSIRTNPENYGISKITETVIENTIILQDSYKECSSNLIQCKYQFEIARAAVTAIDQKKTALENLVKLHGQQYFAGPKVPRDLSAEFKKKKEQSEKTNVNIKSKLNRR